MTLKDIVLRNLRRRKAKAGFVLAGLLIAVSTAVALLGLIEAMNRDIQKKLEEYGANILILPKTENLSLTYGGLSLGGVSFEMQEIRQADLVRVKAIKNAANVAAMGPMVLGALEVKERKDLLDDALHATKAAAEEGVIPGGGTIYLRSIEAVQNARTKAKGDEKIGFEGD